MCPNSLAEELSTTKNCTKNNIYVNLLKWFCRAYLEPALSFVIICIVFTKKYSLVNNRTHACFPSMTEKKIQPGYCGERRFLHAYIYNAARMCNNRFIYFYYTNTLNYLLFLLLNCYVSRVTCILCILISEKLPEMS